MIRSAWRVVWPAPAAVAVEEVAVAPPGPGELTVATTVSLISSGTERAFLRALPNTPATFPRYPGYSAAGTVVEVGSGVRAVRPGDRVACVAPHQSAFTLAESKCFSIPAGVSDEEAVFFEVVSMVSRALRRARIEMGDSALVFGAGLMGCLAMKLLRASGALPVRAVVRRPGRCTLATSAGADAVHLIGDAGAPLPDLAGEQGAAVVVDATDSPQVVVQACRAARPLGRVVLLGSARGTTDTFNFYQDVHRRGLTLIGGHASEGGVATGLSCRWSQDEERRFALRMLTLGRISVSDMISERFRGPDAAAAYRAVCAPDFLGPATLLRWQA